MEHPQKTIQSPNSLPDGTRIQRQTDGSPIEIIYGVGRKYSEALKGIGVETVGDIARIQDIEDLEEPLGVPAATLRKIRLRALSYISGEILQTKSIEFPGDRLIYMDIETDDKCSRVWLIGLLVDGRFTQFYADGWDEERYILKRFLGFLDTHRGYTIVSYSGTCFDQRVMINAVKRHGLDATHLEEFPHVDLCTLLRRSFIFPIGSYGLKELGNYLSYDFKHSDVDGLQVAQSYQRHVEHGASLEPSFLEYNEDDVRVIQHLIDKCFRLRNHSKKTTLPQMKYDGTWIYIRTKLDPWCADSDAHTV